jgi:hypothetical protein
MKLDPATWKWWRLDAAGTGVLALVTLLACFGGIEPLRSSYEGYLATKAELESQRDQAARLSASMAALRRRLAVVNQTIAGGALKLKPAMQVNTQLMQLSAVAVESGLVIDDIRAGLPVPGPYYDTVPIELAGSGTYRQCTMLLSLLRQGHPDTSVSAFTMSANTANPAAPGKFRFSLRWYAAPATQSVASR